MSPILDYTDFCSIEEDFPIGWLWLLGGLKLLVTIPMVLLMIWTRVSARRIVKCREEMVDHIDFPASERVQEVKYDEIEDNYEAVPSEYLERRHSAPMVYARQSTLGKFNIK